MLSERSQKILNWIREQNKTELSLRQASLAELFNCSRRTIGRALKQLKELGLIVDLNKRHEENKCKVYEILPSPSPDFAKQNLPLPLGEGELSKSLPTSLCEREEKYPLTPLARQQLVVFGKDFQERYREWPAWQNHYAEVTYKLRHVTCSYELQTKTINDLHRIRAASNSKWQPHLDVRLGKITADQFLDKIIALAKAGEIDPPRITFGVPYR